MLMIELLVLFILNPLFMVNAYQCKGGAKAPSQERCQRQGRRAARHYVCQHRVLRTGTNQLASNMGDLMGCEKEETAGGGTEYWCCPQYCPDQKTLIYYTTFHNYVTQAQISATTQCTGTAPNFVCPHQHMICSKPSSEFFPLPDAYFCCPNANSAVSQNSNGQNQQQGQIDSCQINEDCDDLGNDCPLRENLCDIPLYNSLMTWQCPFTCGRCPVDGGQLERPAGIVGTGTDGLLPSAGGNANCRDMPEWLPNLGEKWLLSNGILQTISAFALPDCMWHWMQCWIKNVFNYPVCPIPSIHPSMDAAAMLML